MSTPIRAVCHATLALWLAGLTLTGPAVASGARTAPAAAAHPARTEALTVSVSNHVAMEPAYVLVHARLEPDATNKTLTIEWWNADGVGGSHAIPLDGDRSARRHELALKALVSGEYMISALLTRTDRTSVRRETKVIIIGPGERPDSDPLAHLVHY